MQRFDELRTLRQRLGDNRQWFQLGMASATVLTPLLSRWRALRAAERTRRLWETSQLRSRWPWPHAEAEASLPPLARREVRTGLWLAGVSVGLAAAGTAAYVIARRRLHADGAPLDLPLITRVGSSGSQPGDSTYDAPRTLNSANAAGERGASDQAVGVAASPAASDTPAAIADEADEADEAPVPLFVGNMRTLLYAPAADADAPPEGLRVYFADEEQARQAGYRVAPAHSD